MAFDWITAENVTEVVRCLLGIPPEWVQAEYNSDVEEWMAKLRKALNHYLYCHVNHQASRIRSLPYTPTIAYQLQSLLGVTKGFIALLTPKATEQLRSLVVYNRQEPRQYGLKRDTKERPQFEKNEQL